jgi:hypothetical protein
MPEPRLEDVFKVSGVPTYTFVPPQEFASLLVNLRTPGRGLVVEGPSGIGKTTAVEKAIATLNAGTVVSRLSARRAEDVSFITELPNETSLGTVLVDDFHKLPPAVKARLADFLKYLADTEAPNSKLIILGINRAGDSLIDIASDLVNRIDIIRFETNDDDLVNDLLSKGEAALNIALNVKDEIVANANGSFYLCADVGPRGLHESADIGRCDVMTNTQLSFEQVKSDVWERLSRTFHIRIKAFCLGTRQRTDGRAPYLHVLKWLAESEDWSLSTRDAIREHPQLRGSVGQIVEKGYLEQLISGNTELDATVNFDGKQLTIEDPQYIFYLRNLPWRRFAEELGFRTLSSRAGMTLPFRLQVRIAVWPRRCSKSSLKPKMKCFMTKMNNIAFCPKTSKTICAPFTIPRHDL